MQKPSTRELFDYWNRLRGARTAPGRREIDPTSIRTALGNAFILQLNSDGEYDFRLAGSHLCSAYARELKDRSFSRLWHQRDRDAIDTLIRAVTEDNAVALVTFQGTTAVGTRVSIETILLPLRHNGSADARILGAMTAIEEPYWFGVQPVIEQRITGLRLIWPDETGASDLGGLRVAANGGRDQAPQPRAERQAAIVEAPIASQFHGRAARRYAHLAVIDGGRN
jgi:hypothetical protein